MEDIVRLEKGFAGEKLVWAGNFFKEIKFNQKKSMKTNRIGYCMTQKSG